MNSGIPFPEYPRPQLERDSFINLNGLWDYAFTGSPEVPSAYDGKILVPFSPETEASGVNRTLKPDGFLWYRRTFSHAGGGHRTALNFGAVDTVAEVYINGCRAGGHTGGFLPFSIDITKLLREGENELTVMVTDATETSYRARGKQMLDPKGLWYPAQSGIWQTVWLEQTPCEFIERIEITPLFDESAVRIRVFHNAADAYIKIFMDKECKAEGVCEDTVTLPLSGFAEWTVDSPALYEVGITAGQDRVRSFFGMRKVEVRTGSGGYKRVFLNNREVFLHGVLDQGYWRGSLLTPPSDGAMVKDITAMKETGFNMLRKHIKIEPLRWYYHCDRLGMLVIQDFVNGGGTYSPVWNMFRAFLNIRHKDSNYKWYQRTRAEEREEFLSESDATVSHLYNCTSIIIWTPFNEAWGQFDACKTAERVKKLDPTRLVDHVSGWFDQGGGDFYSMHVYFTPLRKRRTGGRAFMITEYGGLSFKVPDHYFGGIKPFGYKRYKSSERLMRRYLKLINRLEALKKRGLCGAVYTQLSDVEDEDNGILTYDRAVTKLDIKQARAASAKLTDSLKERGTGGESV